MPLYAIFRVQPIRKAIDAANATRHGQRSDRGTHYDRERSSLNRHWFRGSEVAEPVDWTQAIADTVEALGARTRAGAPIAAELLLTASPAFFIDPATGACDAERLEQWLDLNFAALEQRFPGQVAAARLDLDESAPHLSVCLVPIYRKSTKHQKEVPTVSYRQIFGGETKTEASLKMIGWQDWYAEAMSPMGLVRGVSKTITHREHLTHQQYSRRMQDKEAELARAIRGNAERDQKLRAIRDRLQDEAGILTRDMRAFAAEKAAFAQQVATQRADLIEQMRWIEQIKGELMNMANHQERRRLAEIETMTARRVAAMSPSSGEDTGSGPKPAWP